MPTHPENQEEPEKYTLEEMMERLKERGHEEGELVTRADGTVAIKVKKRKRRSKQPHKEQEKRNQRLRILQIGIVFFLITAAIATATGMLFYYNSNAFRESTLQKIATWTGADVELAEFTVTPNTAKCATANFTWPEGNYLSQLQVMHPSAHLDISSFLGNKWGGTTVVGKTGKLYFSAADPAAPKRSSPASSDTAFPFGFTNYRCEKLDIIGQGADRLPWVTIEGTEASLIKTTRGTQTRFIGGLVKMNGFQPMLIDRGSIYFELGQMRVENLRFKPTAGTGTLEIQNSIELYSPESSKMELLLSEFPLEILLGNELEVIFSGHVDTPSNALNRLFSVKPGDLKSLKLQVGFRGSERDPLTIRNLPFLNELSRELQNPEYARQYDFSDRVEGELLRSDGETRVQGLRLEKKGAFCILGEVFVKNGALGGTLQVGLPVSLLLDEQLHGALKQVFVRQEDGYVWCEVQLSGLPGQPQDTFAAQLQQAIARRPAAQPSPQTSERELSIEKELEE
jgi:hypothetical protein